MRRRRYCCCHHQEESSYEAFFAIWKILIIGYGMIYFFCPFSSLTHITHGHKFIQNPVFHQTVYEEDATESDRAGKKSKLKMMSFFCYIVCMLACAYAQAHPQVLTVKTKNDKTRTNQQKLDLLLFLQQYTFNVCLEYFRK